MASITRINTTDESYQLKDIGAVRSIKLQQGLNVSTLYPDEITGNVNIELNSYSNPTHNKNILGLIKTRTYRNPNETNLSKKQLTGINITDDGTIYNENILKGILYPDSLGFEDEVADNTINTTNSVEAKYYKKLRYASAGKSGLVKVDSGSTLKINNGYISTEFGTTNKFSNIDIETLNNLNTLKNIENYVDSKSTGATHKFIDNNGLLNNLRDFNSSYLSNKYYNKTLGETLSGKVNTLIGTDENLSISKIIDNKISNRLQIKFLSDKIGNANNYNENILYVYINNDSIDQNTKAFIYVKQGGQMVCVSAPENKQLETENIDFSGYTL